MKRSIPFILLGILAAIVCACSGGGGSAGISTLPGTKTPSQATASIKLFIPSGANTSAAKRPAYIAPGTASFSISVASVNGATPSPAPTPFTFQITNASLCTTGSGGTTCNVTVNVPVASAVVLSIVSYDTTGGVLGQGLIGPIDTTVTPIPPQSVALGGVVASIVANPTSLTAPDDGSTHTLTFTLSAKDAAGNVLISPATYAAPITIAVSGDPNGAVSVSPSSIPSPGSGADGATTVTLTYNSAHAVTGTITLSASEGSSSLGTIAFAPTATVGGSVTIPVVSIQEYALPSPPAYSGHSFGAIASEPGSSTLVMTDAPDSQIIAVPISACSTTTHTCSGIGGSYTAVNDAQPTSIAFDPFGDILISDPGSSYYPFGDVQILTGCSPVGVNCTASVQNGLNQMYGTQPIVTPAPHDAIAGPDGYLYTTIGDPSSPGVAVEPIAEAVGVTYSPAPFTWSGGGSTPNRLTVGTDRAVWFTDAMAGQVGRVTCVTLPCAVSIYGGFNPGASTEPFMAGILAGPDGYMYALETSANEIARFQTSACSGGSCVIQQQIAIPSASANAQYMTIGSDGNLWFTEPANNKIGVVILSTCSSACNVHEYALPTAGKQPWGITSGGDGNIWFTEHTTTQSGGVNIGDLGEVILQ